ncbi:MAG: hypothetical protein JWM53_2730 [bacterium]|nr:hypothetical protein [bacterium]
MKPNDLSARGERSAVLSECQTFRYRLTRNLAIDGKRCMRAMTDGRCTSPRCQCGPASAGIALFIMLNPSTADALKDDPTVRRCIGYARAWGCGELFVENLFAFRSTDPRYLTAVRDPVGPQNNDYIIGAACRAHESGGVVVAAWGVHGGHLDQDRKVMSLLTETLGIKVQCLGTTVEGFPRHPLYLTRDTALELYAGRPLNGG